METKEPSGFCGKYPRESVKDVRYSHLSPGGSKPVMRISYDDEIDALNIRLIEGPQGMPDHAAQRRDRFEHRSR